MDIQFTYGPRQEFRRRTDDLHILGRILPAEPAITTATYSLNDAAPQEFYVEDVPEPPDIDWTTEYKESPAFLRLRRRGQFIIEIPTTAPALADGQNRLAVQCEAADGTRAETHLTFDWNPTPPSLPLDLTDLTDSQEIQRIGQVVTGAFDVDPAQNLIRSRAPVHPDSLLVLGPPASSQEATYLVRFPEFTGIKWLGPSDFFGGHVPRDPPIGIKPGWCTAGMLALNPQQEARAFLAWGDNADRPDSWVVQTEPPERVVLEEDQWYRVRHRVEIDQEQTRVKGRIWPATVDEPSTWLLDETDAAIPETKPRVETCSFSLFQHSGMPIEWADISVSQI